MSSALLHGRSGSGAGRLAFEAVEGRTELRRRLAASPLKLLCPRSEGPVAWAISSHYGGGMVAGDRVDLGVTLGPGAQALIGTQAPGKVFAGEPGVAQTLRAELADGAALAWLPDPLSCFAGAAFSQDQRVDLAPGASLLWCESLHCGRSLRDERWAFARFDSRLRIARGGRLLLNEGLRLRQSGRGLARRMGRYEAISSVFLLGPAFAAGARGLLAALAGAPSPGADVSEAVGAWQEDGALLRLAAVSAEALQGALRKRLAFITDWFGQDPWQRRML